MKTHGTVRLVDVGQGEQWRVEATPAVMTRLKRWFPRVRQGRAPALLLSNTPEVARDLEMLIGRWPMDMTDTQAQMLRDRADQHREREATVQRILAGYVPPAEGYLIPAREPYKLQWAAAHLAIETRRLLVLDELGLGKTFTSLLTLSAPGQLPALVVTLTDLPGQWRDELAESFPLLKPHILRNGPIYDPAERSSLLDGGYDPDVIITSYSKLDKWRDYLVDLDIRTLIFDEIQELRRGNSLKYDAAVAITDAVKERGGVVEGLTATPVYNYGDEIHNVVSVLDDDVLGTKEEFTREWGGGGDKGRVADPRALGHYLYDQGVAVRRTYADLAEELGVDPRGGDAPLRIPWLVNIDQGVLDDQAQSAYAFAEKLLDQATSPQERFTAAGEFDWRMREATAVAKAPHVADFCRLVLESEETLVLFGWHHRFYDVIRKRLGDFHPIFFTGRETQAAKKRAKEEFIDTGVRRRAGDRRSEDPRVLVMSLRAGAGVDGLQRACNVAVFGELDWSPGFHDQCIGRLFRTGQERQVLAYFAHAEYGSDPVVLETLGVKTTQSRPIVDPDAAVFESADADDGRVRRLAEDVLRQRKGSR